MAMKKLTNSLKKSASLDSFHTIFHTQRPKPSPRTASTKTGNNGGTSLLRTPTSLRELERWQQTTTFRLRTGLCRLLSHMYRLRLSRTNECPCGTGIQDPEHSLQNCPTHTLERTRLWPSGFDFQDKLWGFKEELRTTAQFIKNVHLQI